MTTTTTALTLTTITTGNSFRLTDGSFLPVRRIFPPDWCNVGESSRMAQETCHVYPLSQSDLACLAPGTVLAAGGGTPLSAQAQVSLRVGAAVRVIMPDPLVPISGGMGTPNPARAVVFQKGDTTLAVVGLDLLGFPSVLGNRVRARVPRIPGNNILIGATHTHSAPDA